MRILTYSSGSKSEKPLSYSSAPNIFGGMLPPYCLKADSLTSESSKLLLTVVMCSAKSRSLSWRRLSLGALTCRVRIMRNLYILRLIASAAPRGRMYLLPSFKRVSRLRITEDVIGSRMIVKRKNRSQPGLVLTPDNHFINVEYAGAHNEF